MFTNLNPSIQLRWLYIVLQWRYPLAVEAKIGRRENELLVRRPEEDGANIAAVEDGDHDALPPAFVVEAAAHLTRRDRWREG